MEAGAGLKDAWPCRTEETNGKVVDGKKKKKYSIREPVVKLFKDCVFGKIISIR